MHTLHPLKLSSFCCIAADSDQPIKSCSLLLLQHFVQISYKITVHFSIFQLFYENSHSVTFVTTLTNLQSSQSIILSAKTWNKGRFTTYLAK